MYYVEEEKEHFPILSKKAARLRRGKSQVNRKLCKRLQNIDRNRKNRTGKVGYVELVTVEHHK